MVIISLEITKLRSLRLRVKPKASSESRGYLKINKDLDIAISRKAFLFTFGPWGRLAQPIVRDVS